MIREPLIVGRNNGRNNDRVRRYYLEGRNFMRLLKIICEQPTNPAVYFERPLGVILPADVVVQAVYFDHERRAFVLELQSESFDIHNPGEVLPIHGPLGLEFEVIPVGELERLRDEIADLKLQIEALV